MSSSMAGEAIAGSETTGCRGEKGVESLGFGIGDWGLFLLELRARHRDGKSREVTRSGEGERKIKCGSLFRREMKNQMRISVSEGNETNLSPREVPFGNGPYFPSVLWTGGLRVRWTFKENMTTAF